MSNLENTPQAKNAVLMKLSLERHESCISAARAIMHLYQDDMAADTTSFENLWHILNMMSAEIDTLNGILDAKMSITGQNRPQQQS